MLFNIANMIVIVSKCIEGQIFHELALQSYRWSNSLVMLAVELLLLVPLTLYMKFAFNPAVKKEPSGFEWRYLWLIPATFYVIWFYIIYGNILRSSLQIALHPVNAVFFFFINLGACLIYYVVANLIQEQDKNLTLLQNNHRLSMRALQYENLQEKITEARQAKHDIRHHIAVIQEYINSGAYEELRTYLLQYQKSQSDDSLISYCDNPVANSVLLYFAQLAKNNGIEYIVRASIPEQTDVADTDLSVLLGNLLENALDACKCEEEKNRKIVVHAGTNAASLYLTVDNSFTGEVHQTINGVFLSTKHSGAGLGIESVKSIVSRYNGVYKAEQKDGLFLSSVMLATK